MNALVRIMKYYKFILCITFLCFAYNIHAQTINTKPVLELNKQNSNANYRFTFAQITDVHIGEGYHDYGTYGYVNDTFPEIDSSEPTVALQNAVKWLNENHEAKNIKFVIVSGDLTAKAQYSEFMKFKQIMSVLEIPYVPMIGNHDVWQYVKYNEEETYATADSLMNVIFADVFERNKLFFSNWDDGTRLSKTYNPETERTHYFQNFYFEYDDFLFYALDFNPRYHVKKEEPGIGPEAQLYDYDGGTFRWLQTSLANNSKKGNENICVISHHPPIDNILFVLSGFVFEYDEFDKLTKMLAPHSEHLALWLSGHIHMYYNFPLKTMNKWYNIAPLRVIPANKDFEDAYIQLVDVYLEESITTSIKQNNSKLINNIYPNPSTDFINIQLENGIFNAQYKILDINGKTMLQQTISGLQKNITVDISMLEKGNYIMSIENEKRIDTHKFTKH